MQSRTSLFTNTVDTKSHAFVILSEKNNMWVNEYPLKYIFTDLLVENKWQFIFTDVKPESGKLDENQDISGEKRYWAKFNLPFTRLKAIVEDTHSTFKVAEHRFNHKEEAAKEKLRDSLIAVYEDVKDQDKWYRLRTL